MYAVSEAPTLRIDLFPFAISIALLVFAVVMGWSLTREINQQRDEEATLSLTLRLTLVVVVGVAGLVLLFVGLFE